MLQLLFVASLMYSTARSAPGGAALYASSCAACHGPTGQGSVGPAPAGDADLADPEPGNWLMYKRTYDLQAYNPLSQITTDNVADLVPVWSFCTGVSDGHEAPPSTTAPRQRTCSTTAPGWSRRPVTDVVGAFRTRPPRLGPLR
ncbi:MAG: c-type cytochrome [Trueperaceae bacterium]|nr:c-type cytochrome [Trueperaceae bacterium]